MKKYIFFLLIILFSNTACQRNEVIKTHGIAYLDKRESLVIVNQSNKNDVVKILGQPSTKGMTNNNTWIYIERTKARGKILKFGRNYLKKNNVLVLEFDKFGVLQNKEFYNKDKMQSLTFAEEITENDLKKENFIYGFLSSIRQKMQIKKK